MIISSVSNQYASETRDGKKLVVGISACQPLISKPL